MHFVRIGDRAINLDNVAQIELRSYNDGTIAKVYFVGKATTARSCSAKKTPRSFLIMSTMSPNDPSVLPDVYGIQALSEGPTHQPHVVLWDLGLPEGRRRWRPRTTEGEPAAFGHSSDGGDGARP